MSPSQIIREIAALHGVDPDEITGRCRCARVVFVRIKIAHQLDAGGYSMGRIGAILNRDPATIGFYLGRSKKKPRFKPMPEKRKFYLVPYAGAYWPEYDWKERPCQA